MRAGGGRPLAEINVGLTSMSDIWFSSISTFLTQRLYGREYVYICATIRHSRISKTTLFLVVVEQQTRDPGGAVQDSQHTNKIINHAMVGALSPPPWG